MKNPSINLNQISMKNLTTILTLVLGMATSSYAQNLNCQALFGWSGSVMGGNSIVFLDSSLVTGGIPGATNVYTNISFGDGNTATFNSQSLVHTYANSGTYVVCLYLDVISGNDSCSSVFCDTIVVGTPPPPPPSCNASFYADSATITATSINIWNNSTPVASNPNYSVQYAWDFGDGNTSNSAYPSHTYANAGLYNVCLTITVVDNNTSLTCTDTYCRMMGVDSLGNVVFKKGAASFTLNVIDPATVGLDESTLDDLRVYPNPANDFIEVNITQGDVDYTMISVNGTVVKQGKLNANTTRVDISEINNGIYILNLSDGNSSTARRIIVQ